MHTARLTAFVYYRDRLKRRLTACDQGTAIGAAALAAAIVIAISLPLAAVLNIWIDEAFTLHSTATGVGNAWAQAIGFETQPPLYFALEAAWRLLNESSIAFARFPSICFAGAAAAVIVWTAYRTTTDIPPFAVALVTAFNPLIIWAAVELRLYALVLLIGALLTWMLVEGFFRESSSRFAQVGYVLAAIAGLYTQYYIGFVLVAHGITLLIVKRNSIRAFAIAMAAVTIGFVPFVPTAIKHVNSSGGYVQRLRLGKVTHEVANTVFATILPHDLWWSGPYKLAGFVAAGGLIVAIITIGRPTFGRIEKAILLTWVCSIIIFCSIFYVTGTPIDIARHIIVLAPSSLLVSFGLLSALTRKTRQLRTVGAMVFAVYALATLWVHYRPPLMKVGDWQRVCRFLQQQKSGVPVAVFPADLTLLLAVYLPAASPIAIPAPMAFTLDYDRKMTLYGESAVARVLDPVWAKSREIWIVTTGPCTADHMDYDYHCKYLEAYLNQRYRLARTVAFSGALVSLYERSPRASLLNGHLDAN